MSLNVNNNMEFNDFDDTYIVVNQLTYYVTQANGQRLLKLRDESNVPQPPKGTEIFIGKLPRDYDEYQLISLLSDIGSIYKLRLMVDFNGRNRGYAFVKYFTVENAKAAIRKYHNYEIRNGCKIGVYRSVDNCRLFMGNLPKNKTKEDVFNAISPYADGLKTVILYKSIQDPTQNRGFAFLEFEDHRAAAITRRKLAPGTLFLWNHNITVDWADPLPAVDPAVMARVKKLFIRNLDVNMPTIELENLIRKLLPNHANDLVKIYKNLDFAFIHFTSRLVAEVALAILEKNTKLFGKDVEITWARPKVYSKENRLNFFVDTFCTSLPPQTRRLVRIRQELTRIHTNYNQQQLNQLVQYYQQRPRDELLDYNNNNYNINQPGRFQLQNRFALRSNL